MTEAVTATTSSAGKKTSHQASNQYTSQVLLIFSAHAHDYFLIINLLRKTFGSDKGIYVTDMDEER